MFSLKKRDLICLKEEGKCLAACPGISGLALGSNPTSGNSQASLTVGSRPIFMLVTATGEPRPDEKVKEVCLLHI